MLSNEYYKFAEKPFVELNTVSWRLKSVAMNLLIDRLEILIAPLEIVLVAFGNQFLISKLQNGKELAKSPGKLHYQ
jgi:hypothetical protein